MTDIPRPSSDVLRRNAENECGTPIGQVSVKIQNIPDFQTISFYCNQTRLHTDGCKFVGKEVTVLSNHQQTFLIP